MCETRTDYLWQDLALGVWQYSGWRFLRLCRFPISCSRVILLRTDRRPLNRGHMDLRMFEQFVKMAIAVIVVCMIAGFIVGLADAICPLTIAAAVVFALYHVAKGFSSS